MPVRRPPPRIYGICAMEADIVALIAKAGQLTHIFKWDLTAGSIEPGARFRGSAYPRRCDVSPDGRYLFAFLMRSGKPHTVVSRLPWVYGLSYQEETDTWGRGKWFMTEHETPTVRSNNPEPTTVNLSNNYTLRLCQKPGSLLFNEYRRGWVESPERVPRPEHDVWDEQRPTVILERSPKDRDRPQLRLDRGSSCHYAPGIGGYRPTYCWREKPEGAWKPLPDAAWADFSHTGKMVYTTWAGDVIEAKVIDGQLIHVQRHSLAALPTDVTHAPDWARTWE